MPRARSYEVEDLVERRSFDPPGPHPHGLDDPTRMTDLTARLSRGEVWVSLASRLWLAEVITMRDNQWGGAEVFGWTSRPARRSAGYEAGVPLWAPASVLLALPSARALRELRRPRRFTRGLRPACGYDLRASPDRCPECGMRTVGR